MKFFAFIASFFAGLKSWLVAKFGGEIRPKVQAIIDVLESHPSTFTAQLLDVYGDTVKTATDGATAIESALTAVNDVKVVAADAENLGESVATFVHYIGTEIHIIAGKLHISDEFGSIALNWGEAAAMKNALEAWAKSYFTAPAAE
jgi:hypothetical protein